MPARRLSGQDANNPMSQMGQSRQFREVRYESALPSKSRPLKVAIAGCLDGPETCRPRAHWERGSHAGKFEGAIRETPRTSKPAVGLPIRSWRNLLRRQADHALQDLADHLEMRA